MPRQTIIKKKYIKKTPRLASTAKGHNNNNSMKKELIFPLTVGIIFGAMVMMFWQFTARINNQSTRLVQLEEFATQNAKTVNDVVTFINQNLAPEGGNAAAPVVTE